MKSITIALLFALTPCFAQQSAEVRNEVQSRVESPDRSVNALDLDQQKPRGEPAARRQGPQPLSTWSPKRYQAGKTPLDAARIANRPSTWTLERKPVSAATGTHSAEKGTAALKVARPRLQLRHTTTGAAAAPVQPGGAFNPGSQLVFDPTMARRQPGLQRSQSRPWSAASPQDKRTRKSSSSTSDPLARKF